MKKLLLAGALAIVGMFSAQDKGLQGTWFATAQIGYSSNGESGAAKSTTTVALPIVGTFVAPTTAVGIGAGVISTKNGDAKATHVVVEPLVRKYWNVSGPLYFFGQVAAPMIFFEGGNSQYGLTLTPGLDYVMTKHFTVEFSATVANLEFNKVKGGNTSTSFGVNPMAHSAFGTNALVGFKFLF